MAAIEDRGFTVYGTADVRFPVLISVPHAGRDYPSDIFENLRLPPASLIRLEDRYADLLARVAINRGFPAIVAHKARAWIDLNRHEQDIDVAMVAGYDRRLASTPSAKQRGGLGLIPRRLAGEGDLWKRPFTTACVERRLTEYYRPYHAMVQNILQHMQRQFGIAILLDLHTMPPISDFGGPPPQFVIGDRFGRSAASRIPEMVMARLRQQGFACALNHPYSGDHILMQHGVPRRNIHAIQLEIDRSLYLDPALREPMATLGNVADLVAELAQMLADGAAGAETLLAAE